ncbi:MAG: GWxTD domain-containing protein [candidate division KSB1 bacterium]|nr:GWxTD domain-containing protein [candidate division KSB1 bacterium]MDZ7368748.1 GWxTD domain-containing protein [candidate division KSB1 bacterium]MDZ7406435.1 GWxTD domain-containing protein [candidate division KSB1 bacterium]
MKRKVKQNLGNGRRANVCFAGFLVLTFDLAINAPAFAVQVPQPLPSSTSHRSARDSIQTERQYFAALRTADSTTFQKEFESEFLLILNPTLRQSYDSLTTLAERKAFVEYYWKASNPAPLLSFNLRLREHLRRREFARQNFPAPEPPYFDDRGKYYLKYGRPVQRFEDPGGLRRVEFFSAAAYRAIQSQYSFKGGPEQNYSVTANESWAYPNVSRDFVVHFMKDGPAYREIESLTELLASHQQKNLPWQWSDLIKQRAAISPFLGQVAQQIERFESAVLASSANPNRPGLLRAEVQSVTERLSEVSRGAEQMASQARRSLPATAYEPMTANNRLVFQESIAQFRGPHGHTRVEITLLAPLKKNFVDQLDSLSHDTIAVEFAWMLRDENLDSLAARRWQNVFPAKSAALENLPNAVGRSSFLALPQQIELALQVQSRRFDKLGYAKRALNIRDFSGPQLLLSDLQFYTEVRNEAQSLILPTLEKQNLLLAPYPYLKIRKRLLLFCYFEIYNLRAAGITESYEITYKIVSNNNQESLLKKISRLLTGGKEAAISISQTQPVVDDASPELIALDLGNLGSGAHRLEITVADAKNANRKANVTREIVVED